MLHYELGELLYENPLAGPDDIDGFRMEGDGAATFSLGRMRLESTRDPDGRDAHRKHEAMRELGLWDRREDTFRTHLTIDDVIAIHPQRDAIVRDHRNFMNAKFSTDGSRLLIVFTNEVYRRSNAHGMAEPRVKDPVAMHVGGDPRSSVMLYELASGRC